MTHKLFAPNLTPKDCIQAGIFGGTYFSDKALISVKEFPADWFEELEPYQYESRIDHSRSVNCYGVHAGTSQAEWAAKGWMHPDDPRGWFQWYCRYYLGRRHEDDARQMARWVAFASVEQGRWTNIFYHKVQKAAVAVESIKVSPVIRQSLMHWAYAPNEADYLKWLSNRPGV